MNVAQVIERINKFKPSALDEEEITAFINELESDIVLNLYNRTEYVLLSLGDVGRTLTAPQQFDKIYFEYCAAKIDEANGQMDMYMLSHDQFNNTYSDLGAYITRNNLREKRTSNRLNSYF